MSHVEHSHEIEVTPVDPKKIKKIWMVTAILALITTIEFVIAFTLIGDQFKTVRAFVFIILTIVKAFYIVAEFMHLGHEKKALVYALIVPFVLFISWAILSFLMEASFINQDISTWY
jgi:cytochrome c oxidase subunit IV